MVLVCVENWNVRTWNVFQCVIEYSYVELRLCCIEKYVLGEIVLY